MGQTNHLDPSVQVYFSLFPVQVDQTNHVDPSVLVDLAVFPVHEVFVVYFDLALLSVHVVSASIRNTLCSLATCISLLGTGSKHEKYPSLCCLLGVPPVTSSKQLS